MTDTIRWGIMGTGFIARTFTRDLLLAGFAVQAVGSRTQDTADAFAAEFDLPTAHGSYEALVHDADVDVVYVATPHPEHHPNAVLALDGGKHLLIEKPITLNANQARDLARLGAEKRLLVLEAMWTRFLPHMLRIREILGDGRLGDVRSFSADNMQPVSADPAHRINALELGGGALLDLGIYPISFASQLFGSPASIVAKASFKETGADAQVATIFQYGGGQFATTISASNSRGRNVATIVAAEGRIEIDAIWFLPARFRVYNGANEVIETYCSSVSGRGMQYQAAETERMIRAGRTISDIMPMEESVSIMMTLDTIRKQIGLRYPSE